VGGASGSPIAARQRSGKTSAKGPKDTKCSNLFGNGGILLMDGGLGSLDLFRGAPRGGPGGVSQRGNHARATEVTYSATWNEFVDL
jgi:hypothetical protein